MKVVIQKDYDNVSKWVAEYVIKAINEHNAKDPKRPFVLGLPTGSSPIGTYNLLVEACKEGRVSFKNVVTFNMDEYIGLPKTHPECYWAFMHHYLFDHVDIPAENINIPDGNAVDIEAMCAAYEAKMASYGGVDLFLGGCGVDGHIAFNEPYTSLTSRTGIRTLTEDTRIVNSRFFDNDPKKVPATAVSVGVGTVMDAKEVLLIVNGHNKAHALKECIEGGVSQKCTISALQMHKNAIVACDEAACGELMVDTYRYFMDVYGNERL